MTEDETIVMESQTQYTVGATLVVAQNDMPKMI